MKLTLDFECRSACDIKKHGAWVYSEHQTTDALMLAVMVDDKPVGIWMNDITRCEGIPKERIFELMDKADIIEAHNVGFERAIWQHVCHKRYGWPALPVSKLRCSMAQCAYHSLPMGLDAAAAALGLGGKDKDGYKLMLKLSKPRKVHPDGSITWWGDEAMFARLADYCMQDVIAEHAISEALYPLPDSELAIWQLDQEINARGILADVVSCRTAISMIEADAARSLERFKKLTHGSVSSPKQVTAFLKWLSSHGCVLPGLTKADVAAGLGMEIRPEVREALQIRQKLGLSSVSKFQAIIDRVSADGRLRGMFMYHGAGTGRWAGRGVQLQNLPRKSYHPADIAALGEGDTNWFDMTEENIPSGMSRMIRGMFMAGPGNELAVADFSSIEARGLAWEAGEEKVLQAFRNGECAYCLAAASIYGRQYKDIWSGYKAKDKSSSDQRQVGKTAILACFGPDTQVVTSNGIKPITEVSTNDLLWDGVEWVEHQGLIPKGQELTINLLGVEVTPDHLIRTKETWTRALELALSESMISQALETGSENLPSSMLKGLNAGLVFSIWSGCNALAEQIRTSFSSLISAKENQQGAMYAQKSRADTGERITSSTQKLAPMMRIEGGYSIGYQPVLGGATTQTTGGTNTTATEGSGFVMSGEQTKKPFLSMCSRWTVGIIQSLIWTVRMWTKGMSQEISGLSPAVKTRQTKDLFKKCRRVSSSLRPVFDILNSGPRKCFTILCDLGPLIVHNCGYQGGVGAFQNMAKVYNVVVPDEQAQDIVTKWRAGNPAIVAHWAELEKAATATVETGRVRAVGRVKFGIKGRFLCMKLPSGRSIHYPFPKLEERETKWGTMKRSVTFMNSSMGKWFRDHTYGGRLAENETQAICRDLLAFSALRVEGAGMPVVLHVHDEVGAEVPTGLISLEDYEALVAETPEWAEGFPVKAEGWIGTRYRK